MRRSLVPRAVLALLSVVGAVGCGGRDDDGKVVRIGHFPNLTHTQGLVAHGDSRAGKGWFEERFGPGIRVEWYVFNAGPDAMNALLAGAIDLTYVGPSPALNAHVRSKGEEVRVLAGAMRGGAALVVQGDGRIKVPADFRGRTVATPQFGNTQDVSARAWLKAQGFRIAESGGDVAVQPTQNPEQLSLFSKGGLDAVWTVEPWVSRLETEAKGAVFLEDLESVTTVLASSVKFLKNHRDLASKAVEANAALTAWIEKNEADAKARVRAELKIETQKEFPEALLDRCWKRLRLGTAISSDDFAAFLKAAQDVGFLAEAAPPTRLVEKP